MARDRLRIHPQLDGRVWPYAGRGGGPGKGHTHAELEVNLITAGAARYLVDDRLYDLTPGTQIWLHAAQKHLLIEQTSDFAMWIVVFRPALVERLCTADHTKPLTGDRPIGMFCKQLAPGDTKTVDALCAQLAEAHDDPPRFNAGLAYTLLAAWDIHSRSQRQTVGSDVHPAVERAARLISAETEPINVDELASRCGLSASRLSRLFKQQTGVSLVHYRQDRQLERFFDIYGSGKKHNITEAAFAAGFGSYAQFHRVFTQTMGQSPADYRRQLAEVAAG